MTSSPPQRARRRYRDLTLSDRKLMRYACNMAIQWDETLIGSYPRYVGEEDRAYLRKVKRGIERMKRLRDKVCPR